MCLFLLDALVSVESQFGGAREKSILTAPLSVSLRASNGSACVIAQEHYNTGHIHTYIHTY
jgi:hypothetical protein